MALRELWRDWRDRLLQNPRFQEWAASNPFTRGVARKRARALFDLCAGFVYTQVLTAAVQLNLFEALAAGPQTPEALAQTVNAPEEGLTRLLKAGASLGLMEPRARGRYGLGPLGAALLGNPGVAAMVRHHPLLYEDLRDPAAFVRGQPVSRRLAEYWAYAGAADVNPLPAEQVQAYSQLMAASQAFIAREALAAYPIGQHAHVLDVGGGEGAFARAVVEATPRTQVTVFDAPPVAARARATFADHPHSGRLAAVGGDFFRDPLPSGADLVTLVRVLHDHDDAEALQLLTAIRATLEPGQKLLIVEPMAGVRGAEPVGDAYFGVYLTAMGTGRPRTPREIIAMTRQAGFSRARRRSTRMPLLACAILVTV